MDSATESLNCIQQLFSENVQTLNNVNKEKDELDKINQALKKEIDKLREEKETMQAEIDHERLKSYKLLKDMETFHELVAELRTQMSTYYKSEMDDFKERNELLLEKLKEMDTELKKQAEHISELTKDRGNLQSFVSELTTGLNNYKDLVDQIRQLIKEKNTLANVVASLNQEIEDVKETNAAQKGVIEVLTEENEMLQENLEQSFLQFKNLKIDIDDNEARDEWMMKVVEMDDEIQGHEDVRAVKSGSVKFIGPRKSRTKLALNTVEARREARTYVRGVSKESSDRKQRSHLEDKLDKRKMILPIKKCYSTTQISCNKKEKEIEANEVRLSQSEMLTKNTKMNGMTKFYSYYWAGMKELTPAARIFSRFALAVVENDNATTENVNNDREVSVIENATDVDGEKNVNVEESGRKKEKKKCLECCTIG